MQPIFSSAFSSLFPTRENLQNHKRLWLLALITTSMNHSLETIVWTPYLKINYGVETEKIVAKGIPVIPQKGLDAGEESTFVLFRRCQEQGSGNTLRFHIFPVSWEIYKPSAASFRTGFSLQTFPDSQLVSAAPD